MLISFLFSFSSLTLSFEVFSAISFYHYLEPFSCSPFPTVAEAIQEELEEYRSSEVEVKKLKASMVCVVINPCALCLLCRI